MTDELVHRMAIKEAGLHFAPDGIHYRDMGIQIRLVASEEYDGIWSKYAKQASMPS